MNPVEGLLTIGDFGAICRLSVKALRHYHELDLLVPAHVDPTTGYRWYRPEQADRAVVIRGLRELGMPVPDVATVLAATTDQQRRSLLDRHRARLQHDLDQAGRRLTTIAELLEEDHMSIAVTDTALPALAVVSRRTSCPTGSEQAMTAVAITELVAEVGVGNVTGAPLILVHGGDENTADQETCLPVPEGTPGSWVLEATMAGTARHEGPISDGQSVLHDVIGQVVARHGAFRMPFRITLRTFPPRWGDGDVPVVEFAVPYDD